jgi:hypothetical protein
MNDVRRSDGGPVPVSIDPSSLRIVAGHLIEDTGECDCAGADLGVGHELECGLLPLMTVDELAALVSGPAPEGVGEVTTNGLTIYGWITNQDGSEVRVRQSAMNGYVRLYGTVHLDVDGARKLRKALDAFIHEATVRRQSNVSR